MRELRSYIIIYKNTVVPHIRVYIYYVIIMLRFVRWETKFIIYYMRVCPEGSSAAEIKQEAAGCSVRFIYQ